MSSSVFLESGCLPFVLAPDVTIEDILIFVISASAIPPLGFEPNPMIHFVECKCLPFASSCDNVLNFPWITTISKRKQPLLYVVLMALALFDHHLFFVIMYLLLSLLFCCCFFMHLLGFLDHKLFNFHTLF